MGQLLQMMDGAHRRIDTQISVVARGCTRPPDLRRVGQARRSRYMFMCMAEGQIAHASSMCKAL
jgi:hypothetical protein